MRRRFSLAVEGLEIEKALADEREAKASGEFDVLYQQAQSTLQDQERADETEDENADESTDTETGDAETNPEELSDVGGSADEEEPDAEVALESFLQLYRESREEFIAQEDIFTKDNLINATQTVASGVGSGLSYLKDIGFEYGPVILKHVYKGILFALDKTLKGIYRGSVAIAKYIKKRVLSYNHFKEKIAKARETLNLIEEKTSDTPNLFSNEVVIQNLMIQNSVDFNKNIEVSLKFFNDYFGVFANQVNNQVLGTKRLIESIVKDQASGNVKPEVHNVSFPDFTKRLVQGYHPESEVVESYVYRHMLPGNVCFLGFMPKTDLNQRDDIIAAFNQSQFFLGLITSAVKSQKTIVMPSKAELLTMLDHLDAICDLGISLENVFTEVIKRRQSLKSALSTYTKFLYNLRNKVSIHDSMVEYIAVETAFLDQTYIAGALRIQDYMVRVLSSSLEVVKEGIAVNS